MFSKNNVNKQSPTPSKDRPFARPLDHAVVHVCDCEATGPDVATDFPIEVTVAVFDSGREKARFSSLIRPPKPIDYPEDILEKYWHNRVPPIYVPERVSALSGIRDAEIQEAPSYEQVSRELVLFLRSTVPKDLPIAPDSILWGTYFGTMEQGFLKKLIGDWAPIAENTLCIKSLVRQMIEDQAIDLTHQDLGNDLPTFVRSLGLLSGADHRSDSDVNMTSSSIHKVFRRLTTDIETQSVLQLPLVEDVLKYQGATIATPWDLPSDTIELRREHLDRWSSLMKDIGPKKYLPLEELGTDIRVP